MSADVGAAVAWRSFRKERLSGVLEDSRFTHAQSCRGSGRFRIRCRPRDELRKPGGGASGVGWTSGEGGAGSCRPCATCGLKVVKCGDAIAEEGSLPESRLVLITTLADLFSMMRQPANTAPAIATNETAAMLLVRLVVCAVPSCVGGGVLSTLGCTDGVSTSVGCAVGVPVELEGCSVGRAVVGTETGALVVGCAVGASVVSWLVGCEVGFDVVGAADVDPAVVGATVVGAAVVGAAVVGTAVVGCLLGWAVGCDVGAAVVGVAVVGLAVVGASVVGCAVGIAVAGTAVVGATTGPLRQKAA